MVTQVKGRARPWPLFPSLLLACALVPALGARAHAATLAGTVRNDLNGNGVVDGADPALPSIIVQLRTGATRGFVLAQTTTDATGSFSFTNVGPGTFRVVQVPPQGVQTLSAAAGLGGVTVNNTTLRFTLTGAEVITTNVFLDRSTTVVSPTAGSISGAVFRDTNGNNLIDGFDAPVAGATILLSTGLGTPVATVNTDFTGAYSFNPLPPGTYIVAEIDPPDVVSVASFGGPRGIPIDPNTIQVTVVSDQDSGANRFLDRSSVVSPTGGSISGLVARDLNGNNVIDGGDVVLPGVTVRLFTQIGGFVGDATTGLTGAYSFASIPPGTYQVVQIVPPNYVPIQAFGGSNGLALNSTTIRVTVQSGLDSGGNNFLDRLTVVSPTFGSVSGAVYRDNNGNGVIDAFDTPLVGVTVQLFTLLGAPAGQTTTGAGGFYSISTVATGFYRIVETDLAGYVSVNAFPGINGAFLDANNIQVQVIQNLDSGGNNFLDRAIAPPAGSNTISGFVIRDLNLNGIPDNEPGLAGATVVLRDAFSTPIASVVTDITGVFSFSGLASGTYTMTASAPGLSNTNAISGQNGVRLSASTIQVTTSFGRSSFPGQRFLIGP